MRIFGDEAKRTIEFYGLNQAGALTIAKIVIDEYKASQKGGFLGSKGSTSDLSDRVGTMFHLCPEDEYDENPLDAIELPKLGDRR